MFVFAAGACVGSFLNVVALRYHTGRSVMGRSACFSCGRMLGVLDLVPVLSFLVSGGHCRYCGSSVSLQYPFVEAGTGLLFLALYLFGFPLAHGLYLAAGLSLLMVIIVYDLKHKIIPDLFVYAFAVLAALSFFFNFETLRFVPPAPGHVLAGPLFFAPFFLLWLVSRGRWLGLGDGKLAWGIGWLLGLSQGAAALLLSVWIGAAASVALLVGQRALSRSGARLTMKSEVPFAPFLILGLLIALFFNVDFSDILSFFAPPQP